MLTTKLISWASMALIAAAPSLRAQQTTTAPAAQTRPAGPEIIELTLHPASASKVESEYKLLPDFQDQTRGDAASLYLIGAMLGPRSDARELNDRVESSLDVPLDQLPGKAKEAQSALDSFRSRLRYFDLAGTRRSAHWDVGLREFGWDALLPYLNTMRQTTSAMELRARLQIAQGDWAGAARSIRTTLAMARHLNSDAVLIQGLVETGVAEAILSRGVEGWITRPGAPNLYWELTNLPEPFVELRSIEELERANVGFTSPVLGRALNRELPPDRWPEALAEICRIQSASKEGKLPANVAEPAEQVQRLIDSALPQAREYLVSTGMPKEKAEAMPPAQAVGMFLVHQYHQLDNQLWEGWDRPYPEAAARLQQAEEHLMQLQNAKPLVNPFVATLPRAWRARTVFALLDRHIALLRTIEALRDYASRHGGAPPHRLDDVSDLPVPLDPLTGQAFDYKVNGQAATLEGRAIPGGRAVQYKLTFAK